MKINRILRSAAALALAGMIAVPAGLSLPDAGISAYGADRPGPAQSSARPQDKTEETTPAQKSGELIVSFRKGTSNAAIRRTAEGQGDDVKNVQNLGAEGKTALISLGSKEETCQAAEDYEDLSGVEYAQPNYIYHAAESNQTNPSLSASSSGDKYYQYFLDTVGAQEAWNEVESDSSHGRTTVAVLDSGLDTSHEDLQKNVITQDGKFTAFKYGKKISSSRDTGFHGTHVSGIIGATYGNGKGVSGAASGHKNDLVRILPVGISADGQSMTTADIVAGINYAADQGAKVINMSFAAAVYDRAQHEAVRHAYYDEGIVLVAAAGNIDSNATFLVSSNFQSPADFPEVLCVTATTKKGEPAAFSVTNNASDIAAPGASIMSTIPRKANYAQANGTSMASPIVASAAALMLDVNPNLTPAQVYNILMATAGDEGKFSAEKGYGIVNLKAAVAAAKAASDQIPATGISMRYQSPLTLVEGEKTLMEKLVLPADSLQTVTWTSSDPSAASVDQNGLVTAVSSGGEKFKTCTITASVGGHSASWDVWVFQAIPMTSVRISFAPSIMGVKDTITVIATASPSNATDHSIFWTSSNPNVVRINDYNEHLGTADIQGISPGTATLTARSWDGKVKDTCVITVKPQATNIRMTSSVSKLKVGSSRTFSALLTGSDGSADIAHPEVEWKSSRRSAASVGRSTGRVKGIAPGITTITASSAEGPKLKTSRKVKIVYSAKSYMLKAAPAKNGGVKLTWKKRKNTAKYVIRRASSKKGKYKTIKTLKKGAAVTWTDRKTRRNQVYYYKITAKFKQGGKYYSNETSLRARARAR